MQILHFDWLRYYRSISNSHRAAKFAGVENLFISFYSQINIFFADFIIAFFCPTSWVILKPLRPRMKIPFGFASWAASVFLQNGYISIAMVEKKD